MNQINGIGSSAVTEAQLTRVDRGDSTILEGAAKSQTSTVDSARFSTTALLVQKNAGAEDVRYEKVASIKAAIDAGTYSVSATVIADKLIESMSGF